MPLPLTAEELKTSATYNEMLRRTGGQDSLNVRLAGPDGSFIIWGLRDPVDSTGWGASRVEMVTALLPHIRQFVSVRQALVRAEARHTTVTALLDNHRIGVVHLDRRGRIMEANDRARDILRRGDGLSDRGGALRARVSADRVRLEQLVGDALPASGTVAVCGSMLLRRSPPLAVVEEMDDLTRPAAAELGPRFHGCPQSRSRSGPASTLATATSIAPAVSEARVVVGAAVSPRHVLAVPLADGIRDDRLLRIRVEDVLPPDGQRRTPSSAPFSTTPTPRWRTTRSAKCISRLCGVSKTDQLT